MNPATEPKMSAEELAAFREAWKDRPSPRALWLLGVRFGEDRARRAANAAGLIEDEELIARSFDRS
jgi:hypothetical protein